MEPIFKSRLALWGWLLVTAGAQPALAEEAANNAAAQRLVDVNEYFVRGNTVLAQPEDSGMIRIDESSGLGVAVSTDCNGRFVRLDPYEGAKLAVAEACRSRR